MCLQLPVTNHHQLRDTKGIPETWVFQCWNWESPGETKTSWWFCLNYTQDMFKTSKRISELGIHLEWATGIYFNTSKSKMIISLKAKYYNVCLKTHVKLIFCLFSWYLAMCLFINSQVMLHGLSPGPMDAS